MTQDEAGIVTKLSLLPVAAGTSHDSHLTDDRPLGHLTN